MYCKRHYVFKLSPGYQIVYDHICILPLNLPLLPPQEHLPPVKPNIDILDTHLIENGKNSKW